MNDLVTPAEKFQLRCDARALLWQLGEFGDGPEALHIAVDGCLPIAHFLGLRDTDEVQLIMARAFSRVRDDLGGWVVP